MARASISLPAAAVVAGSLAFAWNTAAIEGAPPPAPGIRGFSAKGAATQRDIEKRYRAIPSAEEARKWHRRFTSVPHPATSKANHEQALDIAEQWKAQGLEDVVVRRYDVLSSNPREIRVEMVQPTRYVPTLREDAYKEDPDTAHPDVSGAWISFSASGDVTAPVVYANSGNPADYDRLREAGIDPRGKIVVVRYSNPYSYRGFKALTAQREGAAAMIVYSDPAEDGEKRGPVFPNGPWGPDSHVQRGGIAYDYIIPGDPLTPGWASIPGAPRIAIEDAVSVPKVIAVAMSHRDVKPILAALGGPMAPPEWQGGLPLEYRLGGAAAVLHLKVDMQTDVQPNYVVEGRIKGSDRPDEWIVLGNHHDAWVFGGVDPSSGTASMMEMTRALGQLLREGTRPRRTLVFCSWDGEEVTLTGSTEWGEQLADELRRKTVAYLNVDSSVSGPRLDVTAVGSLAPTIVDLTRELEDPSGVSLYEAWTRPGANQGPATGALPDEALVEKTIGSGSDHTVFINYLARPTVEMTFRGPYGVYHSQYDDHFWMTRFGDPGFRYHALMAELWGGLALRLANADILPVDVEAYAAALRDFIRKLEDIPGLQDELALTDLVKKARALRGAGRRLNVRIERALAQGGPDPAIADRVNRSLLDFEGNWASPAGIPGRPWFKHLLYAPRYTYAAMTLPGITEAGEARDWPRAREQAALVAAAIEKNTTLADAAAKDLSAFRPPADSLEARLRAIRDDVDGRMAIYVENVATGETLGIDADTPYETFSVIKVPIMATVLQRVKEGKLRLDDRLTLRADQRRIPSGVLYALDPGLKPTVRDLLTLMTIISDNEATDALGDLVGRDAVTSYMASLRLPHTVIRFSDLDWDQLWLSTLDPSYSRASGDKTVLFPFEKYGDRKRSEAFRHVIEDTGLLFGRSTAREMGRLFALMARGTLVSKEASDLMISILKRQQVNDRFPRYLGDDVAIAHKTGDGQPWVANDAGILWVKGQPIVLVAFAGHHRGTTAGIHDAEARVAAAVAHHYGGTVDKSGLPERDEKP